jgi:hypothetical protein
MAAKEKSQATATPKQEGADLLMDFDAPSTEKDPPPPSYNTNFLQQQQPPAMPPAVQDAPPAFDAVEHSVNQQAFPPPPPIDSVLPPPPATAMAPPPPSMMTPPAASAPSFEFLMEPPAAAAAGMHALPPPASQAPPPPEIDEDILAALDPAEREALLEEQRQILEQIAHNKANENASGATARAMSFNQRSSASVANIAASMDRPTTRQWASPTRTTPTTTSTSSRTQASGNTVDLGHGQSVPLHGQEKTQQAIKDGTAVIVQCMSCQNWMQVTEAASLMFCPICQVVCPVEKAGAATSADMDAAAQLAADQQFAEELQNEEYKKAAGGGGSTTANSSSRRRQQQQQQQQGTPTDKDQSWYNWFVGSPAPAAGAAATAAASTNRSAEIRGGSSGGPRLVAAQTGDETQGLIQRNGGGGGARARVAEQKSLFACVADSVSEAAQQMTAIALPSDEEGNVHGVDSSSLLAMPDVSRQRET